MEEILNRIKELRKNKGFSYENMADELNISPSSYRKIEMNQSKLTVDRLVKISEILEAKLEEILDIKPDRIYNQEIKENSIGYQDIHNFYEENKDKTEKIEELYKALLKEKDETIAVLKALSEK